MKDYIFFLYHRTGLIWQFILTTDNPRSLYKQLIEKYNVENDMEAGSPGEVTLCRHCEVEHWIETLKYRGKDYV